MFKRGILYSSFKPKYLYAYSFFTLLQADLESIFMPSKGITSNEDESTNNPSSSDINRTQCHDSQGSSDLVSEGEMQIFIKHPDGVKTTTLDVDPIDTIAIVKGMIKVKDGIAPKVQNLSFHNVDLADDSVLHECGIKPESTLNLVP